MRKKVEHFQGYEITPKILKEIKRIDTERMEEGKTEFANTETKKLRNLCKIHESKPIQEHIILGEDWYISYTEVSENEIEITDWVAIDKVENKFTQTMEMLTALKIILLEHKHCDIYGMLRHSTSYPFYKKLIDKGFVDEEEATDVIFFDDSQPELEKIKEEILSEYDSIEDYLKDEFRKKYEGTHIEDHIYHEIVFNMSDKFRNNYKK